MSSVPEMRKLSVVEGAVGSAQLRLGLMKLQRPLIVRRAVIFALIAWLPLLILSALRGLVLTNVKIPSSMTLRPTSVSCYLFHS